MSSASVPGIFPNTELLGLRLMDGMAAYNTDVEAAVKRCQEVVKDTQDGTKNIIVDVLVCGNQYGQAPGGNTTGNAIKNFFLARNIRSYYTGANEIEGSLKAHPNVQIRYNVPLSHGAAQLTSKGIGLLDFRQSVI